MSRTRKLIRKLSGEYSSRYAKARFLRRVFRHRKSYPGLAKRIVADQQQHEQNMIEQKRNQRRLWNV